NAIYTTSIVDFTFYGKNASKRYEDFAYARATLKFLNSDKEITLDVTDWNPDQQGNYRLQFSNSLDEAGLTGNQEAVLSIELFDRDNKSLAVIEQGTVVQDIVPIVKAQFDKEKTVLSPDMLRKYLKNPWDYNP